MWKTSIAADTFAVVQASTILDPCICKSRMIISRPVDLYGSGVLVELYIDNLYCGNLANGQQLEIPVPEGRHTMFARLHHLIRSKNIVFQATTNTIHSTIRILKKQHLFFRGPALVISMTT
jgi:hypothetical protein